MALKRHFTRDDPYSPAEEIAHAVTHGIGAALSVAALAALLALALERGSATAILAVALYGGALIVLFLASTLHHSLPQGRAKDAFLVADHCAIYLLIAGTYSPFALLVLPPELGWMVFAAVWGLAGLGILLKLTDSYLLALRWEAAVSIVLYLAMGWLGLLVAGPELVEGLSGHGLFWLLAGGLLYTLGVGFYVWRRLRFNHAIWHCTVLLAAVAHFIAVYGFVLPAKL
ncbi:MAG: hemolysin III family protein [Rhodovibrionaceae bacterium]